MLYRGEILPNTLIPDIPTNYGSYSPKNYNREYDGAVPASTALFRSLNVPAVRMLYRYGNERFHHDLRELGFTTIRFSPDHYGLSLILGGAEVNLWELAGVYSSLARVLNHFNTYGGQYFEEDWHAPVLQEPDQGHDRLIKGKGYDQGRLGAGPIWLTFQALREVHRPDSESGWEFFNGSRKVAWKTGTSFGFRDGWAVGITPKYVVSVWTGNADGEGRPGLTGLNTAAPVLFEIFHLLPETGWFDIPYDDLVRTDICSQSGYRPGRFCEDIDTAWIPVSGLHTPPCPFHQVVHLGKNRKFRVTATCCDPDDMIHQTWFILPPSEEWYYHKSHPEYQTVPPLMEGCRKDDDIPQIEIVYPDPGASIYIPKELDGTRGKVIFEAAHRHPGKTIFWSIDDQFVGRTVDFHQVALCPLAGSHILTLVDEDGNQVTESFRILEKEKQ